MSQPSVTQRPATWAGTSNPIVYKFASTNYANAGYRMEVEIWNVTTATKIADANYYPDSSGNLIVDISSFLKANMSLSNASDLTSGVVYVDGNWIKYYIKYQEVWTAASESQVDDVSNLRYAIYGGMQLGGTNTFTAYVPGDSAKKFLRIGGRAAIGLNFTTSIIGGNFGILLKKYLQGVYSGGGGGSLSEGVNRIRFNETAFDRVDMLAVKETINAFTNGLVSNPATFQFDSVSVGHAESAAVPASEIHLYHRAYSGALGIPVTVIVRVASTSIAGLVELNLVLFDSTLANSVSVTVPVTYNGIYKLQTTLVGFVPAYIEIGLSNGTVGAVDWEVDFLDEPASETISILIEEECNTIMLQWKNSLGGDECFPFCCNQEYTFHYSDRKAKRLTLYADNLTLAQWEAIQGLNTLGELYKTPIVELTTSIDRTMATIGQAVYVLNSDGTKTGVNVIGSPNTTNTKQKKHSAFVTIEYPEQFLQ